MSAKDTLCFADSDAGVGARPIIDGFIDHDFMPTGEDGESGYINGSRLTYAGGGIAPVFFQGVRDAAGDRLILSFLCRLDPGFNDNDLIVIALRGQHSDMSRANERMILIFPNNTGVGASGAAGVHPPNDIRTLRDARDVKYYKGNTGAGNAWLPINAPPEVLVKVRSWLPNRPAGSSTETAWSIEVDMARLHGANPDWVDLQDDFGLYFNVISTDGAGLNAVQFLFPTDTPPLVQNPGATLSLPHGIYGHGLIPSIQLPTPGSNLGQGVRFMNGWQSVGRRKRFSGSLVLTDNIEGSTSPVGEDNELVALLQNTSSDNATNVNAEFRFWNYGMGGPNFELWAKGLGITYNPAIAVPAGATNEQLFGTWLRGDVPQDYKNHEHQCMWVQLSSSDTVNFAESSVRRNMNFEHLSQLERDAEVSGEGYPPPADGSKEHDFVLRTFCRTIHVQNLIDTPEEKIDEESRAIVVNTLNAVRDEDVTHLAHKGTIEPKPTWADSIIYVWVTQGLRRTGTTITINGTTYENLDPGPGMFGICAYHEGLNDVFSWSLQGPGLVQYQPGSYGLKVPDGGRVTLHFRLSAERQGKPGDRSDLPRAPWPKPKRSDSPVGPGCLAMLMGMFGRKH